MVNARLVYVIHLVVSTNVPSVNDCHYVALCHCTVSEIIHILEEEWSEQESNRGAEQVEEPTSLTLKQFLDSFNGDENKEVQGVFDAYWRDSQDLTLAKLDEEIGEQRALLDSKEIIASEQDREIDKLWERIASMQLTSTKVHKEIAELHKKIKTLEEKRAISRFTEECLSDALELEGQTGRILCSLALGVDLDHLIFDRSALSLSLSLSLSQVALSLSGLASCLPS
ncbi:hypothetical protein LOK49_LG09G01063 [Camellia lanceoleosa]|uniref:Uncharacterized protein n=1 Tax=Camellia lanceoleosa TaxID=1840588 RepID=A0ACC0GIH7_9ERIC|nr:hypothetical protein LOK49_LG09G01063 [Camellia lanceoleosa]